MRFIGKYSMNIFLIHTFIYYYWFSDFIYAFRYDWCIVAALLVTSLVVSYVIEGFKRLLKYNKLIDKCMSKLVNIINEKQYA